MTTPNLFAPVLHSDIVQRGNGKACTCVIHEYAQAAETQKEPFEAEILLFDIREVNAILKEMYRNYYQWFVDRPSRDEEDEAETLQHLASTALTCFKSILADHKEFGNDQLASEFLGSGESPSDTRLLSKMSQWTSDMMSSHETEPGIIRLAASTAEDLQIELEPFVMEKESYDDDEARTSSIWPLIRLVRVGLRSSLLSRGLIVADLPGRTIMTLLLLKYLINSLVGLGDTNKTRTRTTLRYIRSCAFVIVVAQIGRVLTEEATHQKLMIALKKPGKTKLLICTMIDVSHTGIWNDYTELHADWNSL